MWLMPGSPAAACPPFRRHGAATRRADTFPYGGGKVGKQDPRARDTFERGLSPPFRPHVRRFAALRAPSPTLGGRLSDFVLFCASGGEGGVDGFGDVVGALEE